MTRSPLATTEPLSSRFPSGSTLFAGVLIVLAEKCEGMVVGTRPGTPSGAFRGETPRRHTNLTGRTCSSSALADRHRIERHGFWGARAGGDGCTGDLRQRKRKGMAALGMATESGMGMGFDLSSDLGARMGSFVDGESYDETKRKCHMAAPTYCTHL